jgi:topoisomerase-4 subunit A
MKDENKDIENEENKPEDNNQDQNGNFPHVTPISGLYENWFLEYASYVILERAVPAIEDGFKPVQRRIMHSMKDLDDGRFNKVANVIGHTMQYHPHGDAAIGDAIVNLGQKDLLIETQGNWGDIRTGDRAAAPRYIEARLSKFALEVVFNDKTTEWQMSYDGRKKEPITLPVKFPMVLAQGVDGIAVGLATKIMPHNFRELCEGSIQVLKGKTTNLMPDFPTGGLADFSQYNEGRKGSRIRLRARIEQKDKKTVVIKEIPYTTTTGSLIDSIIKQNEKGKIKIKKVVDNTAAELEVEVHLASGVSADQTIDALYAFTDCEVSISPNACVITGEKPEFVGVNDVLARCTESTKALLGLELEIKLAELKEKWHFSSLEKIFIENRIYRDIEECETWESIIETIDKGLEPYKKLLQREVTTDDITRLTEIRIKRISKFDAFKADELIKGLEDSITDVKNNLENLVDFTIDYFKRLLKVYGEGRERKTEIRTFDSIAANVVAVANQKLYANFKEGFVGYGLKKEEFICECSDIDDVIVFLKDGKYKISKVSEKQFMGKDIIHIDVFRKNDEMKVYNAVYLDSKSKRAMVKRFNVTSVIRDKEYDLTAGHPSSKVLYFTANPNSEAEIIAVYLSSLANARKKYFDYDFSELEIKGRNSKGNILSKHPIRKIEMKEKGKSTVGGRSIWYEEETGRLNVDERGVLLGSFIGEDRILVIFKDGSYELTTFDLTNRYEINDVYLIQKFSANQPVSVVHYDSKNKEYYVKRFLVETTTLGKKFLFVSENRGSKMILATTHQPAEIKLKSKNDKKETLEQKLDLVEFMDIKGWKSIGNKITYDKFVSAKLISPKVGEWAEAVEAESANGEDEDGTEGQPEEPKVVENGKTTKDTKKGDVDGKESAPVAKEAVAVKFTVEDTRENPDEQPTLF